MPHAQLPTSGAWHARRQPGNADAGTTAQRRDHSEGAGTTAQAQGPQHSQREAVYDARQAGRDGAQEGGLCRGAGGALSATIRT